MIFRETQEYLNSLGMFGWKLGLDGMHQIVSALGRPQDAFQAIHIAGSNGKGSTGRILEAIFRASGKRIGLYSSPHLLSPCERIRINGRDISALEFEQSLKKIRSILDASGATYFEALTALAFCIFREQQVDLAIIETGLGGRLDATNVITPECAVITTISLEHEAILGRTLAKIAAEKGGIIKQHVPTIIGKLPNEARETISEICKRRQSALIEPFCLTKIAQTAASERGTQFRFSFKTKALGEIDLPMPGSHQVDNFVTAFGAASLFFSIEELKNFINEGFKSLTPNARLEIVSRQPLIMVDVAHNPDGFFLLTKHLRYNYPGKQIFMISGVLSDKNYLLMLENLRRDVHKLFCVTPPSERGLQASVLHKAAEALGLQSQSIANIETAYRTAIDEMISDDILVVSGSHYVVGEFLALSRT